ncbi:MAG TPA: methyltransferase domain-containing protein [Trebonia sp.]
MTGTRPVAGFTDVDATTADSRAAMIGVLEQMAALPAIAGIRRLGRAALDIRDGTRLLDAGCGLGEETRELARLAGPNGQVTGIDLSEALVAEARRRDHGTGTRYAVGDIAALGVPDGSFDAVRSERVVQHVPDPDAAIAELVRVTAPGGRVCVIDTDWDSFLLDGVPTAYIDLFKGLARDKGLALKPTGRLLRGQFVRAGLTLVSAEPVTIPLTDWPTARSLHPVFYPDALKQLLNVPANLVDVWADVLDEAFARDEFLGALTIWVVAGTKP